MTSPSATARDLRFADLFRAEPEAGRLFFNGRRAVLFDAEALGVLRQQLVETLGEELAMGILTRFGYAHGLADAHRLGTSRAWASEADWLTAGPTLHILEGLVHATAETVEFDRATGHFHMAGVWRNSFEAAVHLKCLGLATHPVCWTLAGYASGYATRFFGRNLLAVETTCVGKGDPCCRWEIRPEEAWGPVAEPTFKAFKAVDVLHQLQSAHARYRDIALSAADWIWETDAEGRFTYCSTPIQDVLGCMPEDLHGRSLFTLVSPYESTRMQKVFAAAAAGRPVTDLECRGRARDGREVHLLINAVRCRDARNQLIGFRGTCKDITLRRGAEEELRRLHELHSLILENTMVGVCFVLDRAFEWVNPRMTEIIGLPQEAFRGASTRLVYAYDEDFERIGRLAYPAMDRGERFEGEIRARRGDGSLFWARIMGKARVSGHPAEESVWVFEDITERKQAEEALAMQKALLEEEVQRRTAELRRTVATLEQTHELKNRFFGLVGHDLRNPLGTMVLSAQLLEEDPDPAKVIAIARRISSVSLEMGGLLDRFLDVNRIDSGRMNPERQAFSLTGLVRDLVERHRPRAMEKGIALGLHLPEGPGEAFSDPHFLHQVLDNLVSNALKFSPRGTAVTVALEPNRMHALLSVVDQGPGLTAVDRQRLFGRFERLSARPTDGERSIGLGLSIVKYLVDALGGRIWVESEPGQGAAFRVDVPLGGTMLGGQESLPKPNCWEAMGCGREPGGAKAQERGVCPAAVESAVDGIHGGKNGGRACWVVAGTFCKGEVQGSFAKKFQNCQLCPFYQQVRDEEGTHFQMARLLLAHLKKGR